MADNALLDLYSGPSTSDVVAQMRPTVYDGRILPSRQAMDRAAATGWDKFPAYDSAAEANARYAKLHDWMERDTADYFRSR